MEWALTLAAFVIGGVFGYVGHTLLAKNNRHKCNNEQLEQTQLEMSQYKQEVSDHFDEQHKQLAELTAQLNRVNQQWNASATLFTSPITEKQLAELTIKPASKLEDNVDLIKQNQTVVA
ncbi:ZapG family protein [Shewanella sp. 125m-7]